MKRSLARSGFSLIEVTLALGVAGFCLIAIMGLLPVGLKTNQAATQQTTANAILSALVSDIRTTPKDPDAPGKSFSKQFKLLFGNPHNPNDVIQYLYFSNVGSTWQFADKVDPNIPTVFYAISEYMPDPAGTGTGDDVKTATLVHVKVAWPYAGVTPPTAGPTPAGFVETFLSLDRDRH
jgi:type II secretory pathway pseudopilin PulG